MSVTDVLVKADAVAASVYKDYRRLIKALMVGVVATLVDTAFLFFFKSLLYMDPIEAKAISFLIGMAVSFYFNKTFTFRNTYDKPHYQFASFAIIGFTQWLLTLVLFGLFIGVIFADSSDLYVLLTNVIVALIGFFYAFTLNKSLTFKIFK